MQSSVCAWALWSIWGRLLGCPYFNNDPLIAVIIVMTILWSLLSLNLGNSSAASAASWYSWLPSQDNPYTFVSTSIPSFRVNDQSHFPYIFCYSGLCLGNDPVAPVLQVLGQWMFPISSDGWVAPLSATFIYHS